MLASKALYEYVKTLIATIPANQYYDWWNENVINEEIQKPYPTPAVFFELLTIIWDPSTQGSVKNQSSGSPEQVGQCEFTLHIIWKKNSSLTNDQDELDHADHVEKVFRKVHFAPSVNFIEGNIQRLRDEPIAAHTVLRDYPLTFSCRIYECAEINPALVPVDPWAADVQINQEVDAAKPYTDPGAGLTFEIQQKP